MPRSRHIPERSCVACKRKLPKGELIRIVRTAQGGVLVDRSGRSPGRGAYLCGSLDCWQRGISKGSLERGLRTPIPPQGRESLLAFYKAEIAGATPE